MSLCNICENSLYPGERTKTDQDGTSVHLRCWHYDIASIECARCGVALTDDEFEIAVTHAALVCAHCHEDH